MPRPMRMHAVVAGDAVVGAVFLAPGISTGQHRPEDIGEPDLFLTGDGHVKVAQFAKA